MKCKVCSINVDLEWTPEEEEEFIKEADKNSVAFICIPCHKVMESKSDEDLKFLKKTIFGE